MKLVRLQLDCGLYGRDWRVVYGGSRFSWFTPLPALVLRTVLFVVHLVVFWPHSQTIAYFTTWTNIAALLFLFTSMLLSIAVVFSLNNEYCQGNPDTKSKRCQSPFGFFSHQAQQYQALVKNSAGSVPLRSNVQEGESSIAPLSRCCSFRRPFSGTARLPALEALITIHDIFVALCAPMVLVTCSVYWTLLFPINGVKGDLWVSIYLHSFCFVAVWLVTLLSWFPYRLCLMSLLIVYAIAYTIIQIVAQALGMRYLYWFLDFFGRPAVSCSMALVMVFIIAPVSALIAWLAFHRSTAAVDSPRRSVAKQPVSTV